MNTEFIVTPSLKFQLDETINFLNPSKEDSTLIIRHDEGEFALRLAKDIDKITLIDSRKHILSILNNKIKKHGIEGIFTQLVNFESLPFEDNKFDIIIARSSIRHFENPLAVFKEINRILKQGGKFLLYEMSFPTQLRLLFESISFIVKGEHSYYWNYNDIISMLRETGFKCLLIRSTEYKSDNFLRRVKNEEVKVQLIELLDNLDKELKKLLRFGKKEEKITMYYETYDIISTK